jgi:hypothetical protein
MSTSGPIGGWEVGPVFSGNILSGLFGSGHASWAPSVFTAVLGTTPSYTFADPGSGPQGQTEYGTGILLYGMTATIPNDDAHWMAVPAQYPGTWPAGVGPTGAYMNTQTITFSAYSRTQNEIFNWDWTGISCTLQDGSGNQIISASMSGFYMPPENQFVVGTILKIGPQNLVFSLG